MDFKFLALNTPGYVGADMLALASEAGMIAVNRYKEDLVFCFSLLTIS
jgi:SpoVK/Ycf46/Vps4 family AAA+-type ATPase